MKLDFSYLFAKKKSFQCQRSVIILMLTHTHTSMIKKYVEKYKRHISRKHLQTTQLQSDTFIEPTFTLKNISVCVVILSCLLIGGILQRHWVKLGDSELIIVHDKPITSREFQFLSVNSWSQEVNVYTSGVQNQSNKPHI